MARARTGSPPTWCARTGTYHGRYTHPVTGKRVRVDLGTDLLPKAQADLARLVAGGADGAVAGPETFAAAAQRVTDLRRADGVVGANDELKRLTTWAEPIMGVLPVPSVTTSHVNAALDACKRDGKSRQTVVHLRQAIRSVFAVLKREGAVQSNPTDDATLPRFGTSVTKERAVLTDAELAIYLAYAHPDPQFAPAVLRRQTMACVARCFGGLRTGDLHALQWQKFDVAQGAFQWGWAPRRKTKRPQLLTVPEALRGILRDWWERAGRPQAGPVFPKADGEQVKIRMSHAKGLRRDLRRAFGVETYDATTGKWRAVRALTVRENELFEETDYTRPVDFHSWRRAYTQALADAGINAQTAQALAGHASMSSHSLYTANSGKARALPASATPDLSRMLSFSAPRIDESLMDLDTKRTQLPAVIASESAEKAYFHAWPVGGRDQKIGQKDAVSLSRVPLGAAADAMLAGALRGLADATAARLVAS